MTTLKIFWATFGYEGATFSAAWVAKEEEEEEEEETRASRWSTGSR